MEQEAVFNQENHAFTRNLGLNQEVDGIVYKSRKTDVGATCGEKIKGSITSLPDDVLSKILLCFRADDLENVIRHVCRDWDSVINRPEFIKMHKRLPTCLLVQAWNDNRVGYLVDIEAKGEKDVIGAGSSIKTSRDRGEYFPYRKLNVTRDAHTRRTIIDSCDGLILIEDFQRALNPYWIIVNPLRKQSMTHAPPTPTPGIRSWIWSSFGRASSSGEYKVVIDYATSLSPIKCTVLVSTVGGDGNWRSIDLKHLRHADISVLDDVRFRYRDSVGGFIYWHKNHHPVVLALDVENEMIVEVDTRGILAREAGYDIDDQYRNFYYQHKRFIKSERFLIMIVRRGYQWEFWALVDTINGEWKKLYEFDASHLLRAFPLTYGNDRRWEPYFVLGDDATIVFSSSATDFLIGYQVKTGSTFRFGKISHKYGRKLVMAHVQSFVPLELNSP